MQVNKGRIGQTCKACGHHCMVDMRHKLTTFILKNPVGPGGVEDSAAGKKSVLPLSASPFPHLLNFHLSIIPELASSLAIVFQF